MGIFDSAADALNRGVASAGRSTKSMGVKSRMADLDKSGDAFYARLGRLGKPLLEADDAFRSQNSELFASIAEYEQQRSALIAELEQIQRQAELAAQAQMGRKCPNCGTPNRNDDSFCVQCGHRLDAPEPPKARVCPQCSTPLREGANFCVSCGYRIGETPQPTVRFPTGTNDVADCKPETVAQQADSPILEGFLSSSEPPAAATVKMPEIASERPKPSTPPATPNPASGVCPACGFKNAPEANFCRSCGASIVQ